MDWSPILISMKTASVSIVITFFFGILAAWWVVSLKNERMKIIPGSFRLHRHVGTGMLFF